MLRTITYNVYGGNAFPLRERGIFQEQLPQRIALELALHAPTLITLQECPSQLFLETMAELLGMHGAFFPGGWSGGLLSRHPIIEVKNCPLPVGRERPEDCFTRHWGYGRIEMPEGPLHVYTAHLHPESHDIRMREIDLMLDVMQPHLQGADLLLFQGDLNHHPDTPEMRRWKDAGLEDAFQAAGQGPRETYSSLRPREALDHIWAGAALRGKATHCEVLRDGAFVANAELPHALALSDHLPLVADFNA